MAVNKKNDDNYHPLSSIPSYTSDEVSADTLVPLYINDILGEVRLLEANTECISRADGLHHYCYTVFVTPGVPSPSSVTMTTPRSSRSSSRSKKNKWTESSRSSSFSSVTGTPARSSRRFSSRSKKSCKGTCSRSRKSSKRVAKAQKPASTICVKEPSKPTPAAKPTEPEEYYDISSVQNTAPVEVTYTTITNDKVIPAKKSFERSHLLHQVLWSFRQKFSDRFVLGFRPRLFLVNGGKKRAVVMEDLHLRLEQMITSDVGKMEILAEE